MLVKQGTGSLSRSVFIRRPGSWFEQKTSQGIRQVKSGLLGARVIVALLDRSEKFHQ